MKRIAVVAVVLVAVVGAVVYITGHHNTSATPKYRVDAVFDDARGLVPGQIVKVAGAKVGQITEVKLTRRYEADVQLEVDSRFSPFHADAACTIRPEGLIAENYVQCDPGTQDRPELKGNGDRPPTIPSSRNTEPVNITDLFNIFGTPTRERFTVLTNELGIALAGRGDDLNAIIRRANPALASTRKALETVNGQRTQLATLITASDRLVAGLAQRTPRLKTFLDRSVAVSERVAEHRGALGQTVHRLPPLLAESRMALRRLDTVASSGTPLLDALRRAAPDLNRVTRDLPAFARAAPAASGGLGRALSVGTPAVRRLAPAVRVLRSYAERSLPNALDTGKLAANLRDQGFFESFLQILYYGASAGARFDDTSHILPVRPILSSCDAYSETPVAGCSAKFSATGARAASRATPRPRITSSPRRSAAESDGSRVLDFLLHP